MLTEQAKLSHVRGRAPAVLPLLGPSRSAWSAPDSASQPSAKPPIWRERGGAHAPLRLLVEQGHLRAQQEAKAMPARNQELLRLLRDWMSAPDDLGQAWWEEFRREMAANRPRFSTPE